MKARGTLLMALLNKDQLKFHSYQDAKLLMKAIEKRYGGNKESKKVQRALLKQQYETFAASSSGTLDQTFDRLQKLISQLEIQDIETISLDDLYNNLKIYEPELTGSSSTSQNPQNMTFISSNSANSTSSINEADNTAYGVSTAHTQGNTVNSTSIDNLSDAVIYAFLASQPNSPQLAREDLEQIDLDDLEEMDLHWEKAMLTIRARRFIKRTSMNLDINGKKIGFDMSKVKCFNCHKNGHFARECRAPKNQENRRREYGRKTVTVENPTDNTLIAQDEIGGDNALVENTKKLEKAEKEKDELKLTLKKFQNSSKSLNNLLESQGNPHQKEYKEKEVIDSSCFRHMIGSKCYLTDYEDYDGRFVSFGDGKGRISEKVKLKKGSLDFNDVYFWIKREFRVARTPQQNGVAERKNKTLIEAARTMALVIKSHNKTPYELIRGRPPLIYFMKPFGCPVTILNTRKHLRKFDEKADEGFFFGSPVSTAGPSFVNTALSSLINVVGTPACTNAFEEHPFERFSPFKNAFSLSHVLIVTPINDTGIFGNAYDDEAVEEEVDMNNLTPRVLGSLTSSINLQCIFYIVRVCFKS
uniref:CCHC-type domain-containing protein n=1 Tax=Tanacetum cinerariifolium TaxID=118510 RepID=A0A699HQI9_TANCI|nr:hypothetical protein [Tanacetum cinerariifolium]